jgi:hypothetical protein
VARVAAGAFGFLIFSHAFDGPDLYGAFSFFENDALQANLLFGVVGGGGGGGGGSGGGLGTFLRKERPDPGSWIQMVAGILSPLHYRTTKLASKVLSRDQIGKTPPDVKAATIIAPAVTAHCFSIFRPVPLVHIV